MASKTAEDKTKADPYGGRLPGDRVEDWAPLTFAVAFTRKMRKHKGVSAAPSLRATLAIPKLLSARWFRKRSLTPKDYLEVAITTAVPEDQDIAEQIARDMLFPKPSDTAPSTTAKAKAAPDPTPDPTADAEDPMAAILGDLADIDLDLDAVDDLGVDLDELLEEESEEEIAQIFDLYESLYNSAIPEERSLAELVNDFGGPAELEAWGANSIPRIQAFVRGQLEGRIADLLPEQVMHGCRAGFGEMLLQQAHAPWTLAGAMAGMNRIPDLGAHLADLLLDGTDRALGEALRFLKPYEQDEVIAEMAADLRDKALARAHDLTGFGEILKGYGGWIEPPEALLAHSVADNAPRAMSAAEWLSEHFGENLSERLFDLWADGLETPPELEDLLPVAVDCTRWAHMVDDAFARRVQVMRTLSASAGKAAGPKATDPKAAAVNSAADALPELLIDTVPLAEAYLKTKYEAGKRVAQALCTEALCSLTHEAHFLPLLDAFLDRHVIPGDIDRVVAAAKALGVDPDEVYDRIGEALEQMRQMILGGSTEAERYKRLVDRVRSVPQEMMKEMVQKAVSQRNLEGMAALLAVDMGQAASMAPGDLVTDSLGYKGIGGGTNLLRQWFLHRGSLEGGLKHQIKAMAKEALIDLAFDWISKGDGSGEQGLIPQTRARPYRAGDELDSLDLEGTLDSIIASGKGLDTVTEEDLFVHETSRGQAALSVLIDISGSMSGEELAICAIAVVMLLGRVRSEEIALAVFESDTHVVKNFRDDQSLDEVADKVLDLAATGGTRVDAALRWAADQFAGQHEAEFRLLFVLSDFCFWESKEVLHKHCLELSDLGVSFLGASHGYVDQHTLKTMQEVIGGKSIKLTSVTKLPEVLLDTLQQMGD